MNTTLTKFNCSENLLCRFTHWLILLRPRQITLGSLIIASSADETALSALPPSAFTELARVIKTVETTLSREFSYQKINYLMLMMVDPHVHWHVIPRYETSREFNGHIFSDVDWPSPPNLNVKTAEDSSYMPHLRQHLQKAFAAHEAPL